METELGEDRSRKPVSYLSEPVQGLLARVGPSDGC